MRSIWLPGLFILAAGCASAPERQIPSPTHLPQAARELIATSMMNHGNSMQDLLFATLFLDKASVRDIAENISTMPKMARPMSDDATELNASLPAEFFDLQDRMSVQAAELAATATDGDDTAMATSFGALMQTCVRCHSTYLDGEKK